MSHEQEVTIPARESQPEIRPSGSPAEGSTPESPTDSRPSESRSEGRPESQAEGRPPGGAAAALPGHLMRLEGESWALWRWVAVRGTGFPAALALGLAAPGAAAAADAVLLAEEESRRLQEAGLSTLSGILDRLSAEPGASDAERFEVLNAARQLKHGKSPRPVPAHEGFADTLAAWRAARERADAARAELAAAFDADSLRVSDALREVAAAPLFREAVTWQNRSAVRGSIAGLLRLPPGKARGNERRKREELVARYLQRYCLKNDTIGFFGPVGWARLSEQGAAIVARPGERLLAERNTYFEGWCIDTLAKTLSRDKSLHRWFAPRRVPFVSVEGATLYAPPRPPARLSPKEATLLRDCDGVLTAEEIAARLLADRAAGWRADEEVFSLLRILSNKGLITWTLEVPLGLRPERTLRELLGRIKDEGLRRKALAPLDELEAARDEVGRAAGDAERLDAAMSEMEATFTRLTGAAPTRSEGELYAGRTLVYEDCRRDLEVEVGPELVRALGRPLALLLDSARWFSSELAARYRVAFERVYEALARRTGSAVVEFADFWTQARSLLVADGGRPVDALLPAYQRRWVEVLSLPPGQRHVSYTSDELRPRVRAAFAAPAPGWSGARHHSPDVMIAAADVEAIRRGDYQFVLGELHGGMNTLGFAVFSAQHPRPEELLRAIESDLPEPRVVPVVSKYLAPEQTVRVFLTLISEKDYRLEIAPDSCSPPGAKVLPVGALLIERRGGGLVLRTRDGRHHFDLVEAFGTGLSDLMVDSFKVLSPTAAGHRPRITIDNLVVSRESWSFAPAELTFADCELPAERFLAARRWARAQGLPRFLFVRVPVEQKPFYLDFDSPAYVDIFVKAVRRTAEGEAGGGLITLSEMLPGPHQTWLPDAAGQTYSCELRIAAFDLAR